MRAFVFTDKSLRRRAGQFVWLSINTEKADNASVLAKFPVEVWPSFYVIDPKTETVALRWVGGATVPQIAKIFDDGSRAVRGKERGEEEILARADKLYGEGKNEKAAEEYREALKRAPPGWPHYSRAMESLLFALQTSHQDQLCGETARDAFTKLRRSSSAANVAAIGLDCALAMPAASESRGGLIAALAADTREILASPRRDIAADDLSSLYETLARERGASKDEEGRRRVLSDWASFLEREAARARSPEERAVFDSHRLSAYLALGEPEKAVRMLEASERDLPDDYNPPARLAIAYGAIKRYEDALAASDRALAKAYGPRKLGLLQTRADIFQQKGDSAAARQTIEEALRASESLPLAQRSEKTVAALKRKLESMP